MLLDVIVKVPGGGETEHDAMALTLTGTRIALSYFLCSSSARVCTHDVGSESENGRLGSHHDLLSL